MPIASVPHTEDGGLVIEGHGVRVVGPLFVDGLLRVHLRERAPEDN
jgi:hypothetical protein